MEGHRRVWNGEGDLPVCIEVDWDDPWLHRYVIEVLFSLRGKNAVITEATIYSQGSTLKLPTAGNKIWTCVKGKIDHPSLGPVSPPLDRVTSVALGNYCMGCTTIVGIRRFWHCRSAPDSKRSFGMESNGFGLALCLDEILNFDRDRFIALEKRFTGVFPHITSIKLIQEMAYRAPVDASDQVTVLQRTDGKGLYFKLSTGEQLVPASQVSDGTLLVLAYLAILYLPQPPRVLLLEEPENGIHPKRLRDVLGILRELIQEQSHTQVVLTTHSPSALDSSAPEEVTLCTMQDNGEVKTTRLLKSAAVRGENGVFTWARFGRASGMKR